MAATSIYLDASIQQFEQTANYRNIGLSNEGIAYVIEDPDDLAVDIPEVSAIFLQVFKEFETKKSEYIDICENFYKRSEEFSLAKGFLEVEKKRLDFVVKIISSRTEVFEEMYRGEEVHSQYKSYLQGDYLKLISDFFPLEKALVKQKEQKEAFEARIRQLEQGELKKRSSIFLGSNSALGLSSPTSTSFLSMISKPLEEISDRIRFVKGSCTQFDDEFALNGKLGCNAIALQALSKLFKDPEIEKIDALWIHDAIVSGANVYNRLMESTKEVARGMGVNDDSMYTNVFVEITTVASTFTDLTIGNIVLKDTLSKVLPSYVEKTNLLQALSQLEEIGKDRGDNSAGGVIACNGKSYAIKVDYNPTTCLSMATLVDSHGYPFNEYAKVAYACQFPDLDSASEYLNCLLRPHDDGSQRFSQFSIVSVVKK